MADYQILFVCMGNICRSPSAEAVFRARLEAAALHERVKVDSAGTHAYHVGDAPDVRAQQAAKQRGYDMSRLRGRAVAEDDFTRFDLVLAMDDDNMAHLRRKCPDEHKPKLRLMMEFGSRHGGRRDVPDPYYGSRQGFENVLDMLEDAADGLLEHVRTSLAARR